MLIFIYSIIKFVNILYFIEEIFKTMAVSFVKQIVIVLCVYKPKKIV